MDALSLAAPVVDLTPGTPPKDLEKACRSLEEAFATLVFRKMHETMVLKSSKGSSGFARETSEGLLDAQWAHLASQGEGLGLWRALYRQLAPAEIKSGDEKADEKGSEESASQPATGRVRGLEMAPSRSSGLRQTTGAAAPGVPGRQLR